MAIVIVILVSQVFSALCLMVHAVRFNALYSGPTLSFRNIFLSTIYSSFASLFFPVKTNELVRYAYLKRSSEATLAKVISAAACVQVYDVLLLAPLSVWAIFVLGEQLFAYFYGGVSSLVLLVLMVFFLAGGFFLYRYWGAAWIFFLELQRSLRKSGFLVNVFLALCTWALTLVVVSAALYVTGTDYSFKMSLMVFWALMIGCALPLLPGSLGTYEGAVITVLMFSAVDVVVAAKVALILRVLLFSVPFLIVLLSGGPRFFSEALAWVKQNKRS